MFLKKIFSLGVLCFASCTATDSVDKDVADEALANSYPSNKGNSIQGVINVNSPIYDNKRLEELKPASDLPIALRIGRHNDDLTLRFVTESDTSILTSPRVSNDRPYPFENIGSYNNKFDFTKRDLSNNPEDFEIPSEVLTGLKRYLWNELDILKPARKLADKVSDGYNRPVQWVFPDAKLNLSWKYSRKATEYGAELRFNKNRDLSFQLIYQDLNDGKRDERLYGQFVLRF